MRVRDFLTLGEIEEAQGDLDREVSGLAYDSRQAGAGRIFFALPGVKADGHDFLAEALRHGAAAVVVERKEACPAGATWGRWSTRTPT